MYGCFGVCMRMCVCVCVCARVRIRMLDAMRAGDRSDRFDGAVVDCSLVRLCVCGCVRVCACARVRIRVLASMGRPTVVVEAPGPSGSKERSSMVPSNAWMARLHYVCPACLTPTRCVCSWDFIGTSDAPANGISAGPWVCRGWWGHAKR